MGNIRETDDIQSTEEDVLFLEEEDIYTAEDDEECGDIDFNEFYKDDETKPKRKVPAPLIILCIVVLTLVLAVVGVIVERNTPGREYADIYEYYGITEEETAVVMDGEIVGTSLSLNGVHYLSQEFITDNLTDKFYYDEGRDYLLYTTAEDIYEIPINSMEYTIGNAAEYVNYVIAVKSEGEVYIAVEFLKDKAFFAYLYEENPNRLVLISDETVIASMNFNEGAKIRLKSSIKADIISDADTDNAYWYITDEETKKGWKAVANLDGRKGYIKDEDICAGTKELSFFSEFDGIEYTSCKKDYDIVLVWHAVYNIDANSRIGTLLANTEGITTVSPTWYKVADETGEILSMADKDYVDYIHSQGMEIWPLISDFTSAEDEGWELTALLDNTENRRKLIDNIINEIIYYGYDGINIDFEHISAEASDGYIQFIRELSIRCRKEQVVLSIDNYVPMAHSMHYNRKAQGECADYIIVMGYDEHYSGGSEAGSVASISFVENGIINTLDEVPADKVINGLPFYTRLWEESMDENGNVVLNSSSCSMDKALELVEELGLDMEWDDSVQQYVATGIVDGVYYSIWLEEDDSMEAKMKVVRENNIAGIAAWCLGMEKDSIWNIITE